MYVKDFIHYKIGFDRGSFASDMILMCLALSACFVCFLIYCYTKPAVNRIKYLFYSKEKWEVIKYIIIIEENIKNECQILSDELLQQAINDSMLIIKQSKQLKISVQSGQNPLQLALKIMEHVLYKKVTSGNGYVYRGVMGVEARANKSMWDYILNEMCSLGYISQEEAKKMRKDIAEEMRNVG